VLLLETLPLMTPGTPTSPVLEQTTGRAATMFAVQQWVMPALHAVPQAKLATQQAPDQALH
jgi:hypothetical protein